MNLPESLQGRTGVVIDTNIWIYLFQDHPRFGAVTEFIIGEAVAGIFEAVITPITIAELLVKPLQDDRSDLADAIRSVLRGLTNVKPLAIPYETGEIAGALRAKYGLPLPDMMQAAAAMLDSRPAMITNDRELLNVREVEVFLLEFFI